MVDEKILEDMRQLNEVSSLKNNSVQKIVTENADSIEIGTPGKGGCIKVYGDFTKPEEFVKKLENAKKVRESAVQLLG